MKIAILTQPLITNYGGILQAYALQTVLERQGHEVVILSSPYHSYEYYFRLPFACMKRAVKKFIFREDVEILKPPYEVVGQYTRRFIRQYIHICEVRRWDKSLIKKLGLGAIVVGSDQVWRPIYNQKLERSFLDFASDCSIKRISYAASFGTDGCEYTPEQIITCSKLLNLFDAVSVRESSGVSLCYDYLQIPAKQVLDPTLLLDTKDYIRLFQRANVAPSKGNLLVYVLDETESIKMFVKCFAEKKGLLPFYVNSKEEDVHLSLKERIKKPVEEWLRGFYDAQYVVTDSFHGCVFSILFKKPFIAIANKERGMSRFTSLLQLFGLEGRLVTSLSDYKYEENTIDWTAVYQILENKWIEAYKFLDILKN